MPRDGSTARDRPPAHEPRGTGALGRRLRRLLAAFAPSLATVGGLVALAVVAPDAGFLALLLVTVGGGLALASAGDWCSLSAFLDDQRAGVGGASGTAAQRAFLARYLWGLVGFGATALAFTAIFLA